MSFDEPPQFIEGVIIFRRKWAIRQQKLGISLFKKQALDPIRTHINYQWGGSCYNDKCFCRLAPVVDKFSGESYPLTLASESRVNPTNCVIT